MSSTTLLICKSCHRSAKELPEGARSDGTLLLEQLQASDLTASTSIQLHPVNCLWVCDHGCAAAFRCADKATYLFSDLPVEGSADALREFAKLYANSKKGHIPWEQFPTIVQTATIAKIPALADMVDLESFDEDD